MRITKTEHKELFKLYLREEERARLAYTEKNEICYSVNPYFNVKYKYKNQEGSFQIYNSDLTDEGSQAIMVRTTDGNIFMAMSTDMLTKVIGS
jgi:hypothetical protein